MDALYDTIYSDCFLCTVLHHQMEDPLAKNRTQSITSSLLLSHLYFWSSFMKREKTLTEKIEKLHIMRAALDCYE